MTNLLKLCFLAILLFNFSSCGDDDAMLDETPQYRITVMSPSTEDKNVDDSIHLHINFDNDNAEVSTVHHINVRIYNKATSEEIYNEPGTAHVHDESGHYEWHDDVVLNNASGVEAHTDWIVEAKVWGHESGVGEIIETIEFHVHP